MPEDSSALPVDNALETLDKENAFLLYAVFCGDVDRTAHALDVDASLVRNLAQENEWDRKLKPMEQDE